MQIITAPFFNSLASAAAIDLPWLDLPQLPTMEINFRMQPVALQPFAMKRVAPPPAAMAGVFRAAVPFLLLEPGVPALLPDWQGAGALLPNLRDTSRSPCLELQYLRSLAEAGTCPHRH